jgi:hypothetical protein
VAGNRHKWWNAGNDTRTSAVRRPTTSSFLGSLFASTKENGGRPGLFDAAFLLTRYRTEFGMIDIPAFVWWIVMPIAYAAGTVLGKYAKFKDAPAPVPANRMR